MQCSFFSFTVTFYIENIYINIDKDITYIHILDLHRKFTLTVENSYRKMVIRIDKSILKWTKVRKFQGKP